MTILKLILRELVSLFIDDGRLAILILAAIALAATISTLTPPATIWPGLVLLIGCALALAVSVNGAKRR